MELALDHDVEEETEDAGGDPDAATIVCSTMVSDSRVLSRHSASASRRVERDEQARSTRIRRLRRRLSLVRGGGRRSRTTWPGEA